MVQDVIDKFNKDEAKRDKELARIKALAKNKSKSKLPTLNTKVKKNILTTQKKTPTKLARSVQPTQGKGLSVRSIRTASSSRKLPSKATKEVIPEQEQGIIDKGIDTLSNIGGSIYDTGKDAFKYLGDNPEVALGGLKLLNSGFDTYAKFQANDIARDTFNFNKRLSTGQFNASVEEFNFKKRNLDATKRARGLTGTSGIRKLNRI